MQHIQIRIRGHWHWAWCLVARWIPWDHHEPWCTCQSTTFYVCMFCHKTSHHPEDARNRYCGACHMFADPYLNTVAEIPHLVTINPETGLLDLTEEGVNILRSPHRMPDSSAARVRQAILDALNIRQTTQAELARRCQLSAKHVNQALNGKAGLRLDLADRMLSALGYQLAISLHTPTTEESPHMPQPADPTDLPKYQQPPSEARCWRVTHTWYIQAPTAVEAATAAKQQPPDQVETVTIWTVIHKVAGQPDKKP